MNKFSKYLISLFLIIQILAIAVGLFAYGDLKPYAWVFNGRWNPSQDPVTLGNYDYQDIQNLRRDGNSLKGVSGQSKINTTGLSTYIYPRNGFQFRKEQPSESHVLLLSYNSNVITSSTPFTIWENETAVPDAGDFNASALYTDSDGAASTGRFAKWPQGNMGYADGSVAKIWGGDEYPITAFITSTAAVTADFTDPRDYTDRVKNTRQTSDQIVNVGTGGGIDTDVKLMLHFDGSDSGTTFTDSSAGAHTMTAVGTAVTDTDRKYFGTASGLMDGNSDYVTAADHADFDLDNVDFTLDFWVYLTTSQYQGIFSQITDVDADHEDCYLFAIDDSEQPFFSVYVDGSATTVTATSSVSLNTWTHVAFVRSSGTLTIYIDGISSGSGAVGDIADQTSTLRVGYSEFGSYYLAGSIDELRWSLGKARWTTDFVVPAAPYSTSATHWLVGTTRPLQGVKFYIANANTEASTLSCTTWDGSGWVSLTITDNTSGLDNTNTVTWTSTEGTSQTKYLYSLSLYWYQFTMTAGEADIYYVTADAAFQDIKNIWSGEEVAVASARFYVDSSYKDYTDEVAQVDSFTLPLDNSEPTTTKLHLRMNGTDGSTSFLDSSSYHKVMTAVGDAQLDTDRKAMGSASGLFDGTGDYLTTPDSSDFDLSTSDFTLDCFIYLTDIQDHAIASQTSDLTGGTEDLYYFLVENSGGSMHLAFVEFVNGTPEDYVLGTTALSLNTWTHVAFVRSSGILTLYVNGISDKSGAVGDIADQTSVFYVGYCPYGSYIIKGSMDEFRYAKGLARWSTNFNPPSDPEIYLGFTEPMQGFNIYLDPGKENANAAVLSTEYWDGVAWEDVSSLNDGTDEPSGTSMGKSGVISFQGIPIAQQYEKTISNDVPLYYYKLTWDSNMDDEVEIDYITGIPDPRKINPYKFPVEFQGRAFLFSETNGEKNKAIYSAYNAPDIWNGADAGTLWFGDESEIIAVARLYNVYLNTSYDQLLVFKKDATYRLYGDGPENWIIQELSDSIGCVAPFSVVVAEVPVGGETEERQHVAIWQSQSGIVLSNGKTIIPKIGDDVRVFWDDKDSRYIPVARQDESFAWYDPNIQSYKILISSGSGQTIHNTELEYSLIYDAWTKIKRTNTDYRQDDSDFTEYDVKGTTLTLTDWDTVTVSDLDHDEATYLIRDMGTGYFGGDFEFHVHINTTSITSPGEVFVWALSNTDDTPGAIDTASGDYIGVYYNAYYLWIERCDGGALTAYQITTDLALATDYYLKIVRDESVGTYGTLYCYIYTDPEMSTLYASGSLALGDWDDWRYLYWMAGSERGLGGSAWSGTIEELRIISGNENPLQIGFQVKDTSGVAYTYGAPEDTFMYRLENGNNWNGVSIDEYVQTKDMLLDDQAPFFFSTLMRYLRLAFINKSTGASEDIEITHYCEDTRTVEGTYDQALPDDIDIDDSDRMNTQDVLLGPCLKHSVKLRASMTSVADGMELTGMGFMYESMKGIKE